MHPRYKTYYFLHQRWPEEWIDEALSLVRKAWQKHYAPKTPVPATTTPACPSVRFTTFY
jgi:hypothetical protein